MRFRQLKAGPDKSHITLRRGYALLRLFLKSMKDINRSGGRRLQLNHYYSQQKSSSTTTKRSWIRSSVGGSLLRVWHIDYSVSLNLHAPGVAAFDRDRINAELLSVQREFHDWTATFNFEPSRFLTDRAFYFKAQLKDIPQIRFERGDSRRIG